MRIDTKPEVDILHHVKTLDYPTPYFFTSKDILKKNYELFTHLFDNAEIYYALKANSDPKILQYLDEMGSGFEAASLYEIELLIKLGVNAKKIIYGTAVKPATHIIYAHKAGIDRYAADSKEEVEKIASLAPGARIFIRTVVDDTGSVFTMSERFGAPITTVKNLLLFAIELGLKPYGISFYVGSQATNANRWANGINTVKPVIEELAEQGIKLDIINIGGGFPASYKNHKNAPLLPEIVARIHNSLHTLPYIPKIIMEPGRGLVANSTVLVSEVIARNDRSGKPWLVLDAGIYNALYEAMVHQGATEYTVHPLHPANDSKESMICTLAGPTGDSLDVIARNVVLPAYIGVGDRLIFENAGAYTIALACAFNGFPKPELYIS